MVWHQLVPCAACFVCVHYEVSNLCRSIDEPNFVSDRFVCFGVSCLNFGGSLLPLRLRGVCARTDARSPVSRFALQGEAAAGLDAAKEAGQQRVGATRAVRLRTLVLQRGVRTVAGVSSVGDATQRARNLGTASLQ